MALATGIAQSLALAPSTLSAHPALTAWRMRWANKGWSLRKFEPTTSAPCKVVREAIDVPR